MGSDWPVVTQLEEEMQVVPEEGLTENLVLWWGTITRWGTLRYRKLHRGRPTAPSALRLFLAWYPTPSFRVGTKSQIATIFLLPGSTTPRDA